MSHIPSLTDSNLPFLLRSHSSGNSGSRMARLSEEAATSVIRSVLRRVSFVLLARIDSISSSAGV